MEAQWKIILQNIKR